MCDSFPSVRLVVSGWSELSGREFGRQKAHVEKGVEEGCQAALSLHGSQ